VATGHNNQTVATSPIKEGKADNQGRVRDNHRIVAGNQDKAGRNNLIVVISQISQEEKAAGSQGRVSHKIVADSKGKAGNDLRRTADRNDHHREAAENPRKKADALIQLNHHKPIIDQCLFR
jgi:hypothetical protein